eukprot:GHVR01033676.1.p1 GENE.GHVR01033676.1~~GHVR01033676.1.p1  ORF type:complete len:362 (-),score=-19.45 GHVR01033676.1:33-1118(-)
MAIFERSSQNICSYFVIILTFLIKLTMSNLDGMANYHAVYMLEVCNGAFDLSQAQKNYGYVRLTRLQYYYKSINCRFTIQARPGEHLYASVRRLDLDTCTKEYFILYDGYQPISAPLCGYVNKELSYGFFAKSGYLTIHFTNNESYGHSYKKGFEITFTSLRMADTCSSDNEIKCPYYSGCIPKELRCDTIKNCEDLTDESGCFLGPGAIIGIVLGSILLVVLIIFCGCYCRYKRKNIANTQTDQLGEELDGSRCYPYTSDNFESVYNSDCNASRHQNVDCDIPSEVCYTNDVYNPVYDISRQNNTNIGLHPELGEFMGDRIPIRTIDGRMMQIAPPSYDDVINSPPDFRIPLNKHQSNRI